MIKEPDYLIEYRQTVKSGPPKCCHTCDFYGKKYNFCSKFDMNPPETFVNERDACNEYIEVIPF